VHLAKLAAPKPKPAPKPPLAGEVLLDGRNRRAACSLAGVAPSFARLPLGEDPVEFIKDMNGRRDMTVGQRALIAAKTSGGPPALVRSPDKRRCPGAARRLRSPRVSVSTGSGEARRRSSSNTPLISRGASEAAIRRRKKPRNALPR
jgi:hypothetical protein